MDCVRAWGLSLAAFVWVVVLRRRAQQQTEIIRERLQTEAALKERYEDFVRECERHGVHTRSGRQNHFDQQDRRTIITASRASIVSQSLIELMADEHRSAARQWLEQVVNGVDVPTAEWDFVNASGQRIKLEISSRLIEQAGRIVEIEGIARTSRNAGG